MAISTKAESKRPKDESGPLESDNNNKRRRITSQEESFLNEDDIPLKLWQYYFAYSALAASISCLTYIFLAIRSDGSRNFDIIREYLIIPQTVGDVKKIGSLISSFKDDHYYAVFGAYLSTYILLQSFCIPGSIVLSILAGYLFPAPLALLIICACSTIGASTFYIMISNRKRILLKTLNRSCGSKVERFNTFVQSKVKEYKSNLFICVFLLRATPIFPNWTINLCSPLINIPLQPFVLGTFTGVVPLSVIHVWTGRILNDLSNDKSLLNWQSGLWTSLVAICIVFLIFAGRYARS